MNRLRFRKHECWLVSTLFLLFVACGPGDGQKDPVEEVSQAALDRTKWVLASYGPEEKAARPIEGFEVTAAFDNGNEMYGIAGCNNYFARYEIDGRSMAMDAIEHTKMLCSDTGLIEQETAILSALAGVESIHRRGVALVMRYDGGSLTFVPAPTPAPTPLTRTAWRLETIVLRDRESEMSQPVPEGILITAVFETGQVTGQTGCNYYGFRYQASDNRLSLLEGEVTTAGCVDEVHATLETQFLAGLKAAESYSQDSSRLAIAFSESELTFRPWAGDIESASITIDSVQIEGGRIHFVGTSSLPDGTCLQTQLLANEEPVSWWPAYCAEVQNGAWEMVFLLGTEDAPNVLDGSVMYTLTAWQQDNPIVKSETFYFDLAGPPPAGEG